MRKNLWKLLREDSGAVAIEYSLIAGFMFLAISPAFYLVRDAITAKFELITSYLNSV